MVDPVITEDSTVLLRYGVLCLFVGTGFVVNDRLARTTGMDARSSAVITLVLGVVVWYGWGISGTYTRWAQLIGTILGVLLPFAVCLTVFRDIVGGSP